MAEFYFAKGVVRYKGDWIIIEAPHDVVNYYKWWVEKLTWKKISTSYHGTHITVLAGKHEKVADRREWGRYDGEIITFKYFSTVYSAGGKKQVTKDGKLLFDNGKPVFEPYTYFWLRTHCPDIPKIRTSLGLKPLPKLPPHLTIGYCGY
jgi:hypothetical protein